MENNFDEYIRHIVGPLNTTRKIKKELADEIRDHLEMLAKENEQKGFERQSARQSAMMAFGNSAFIRHKLSREIKDYRSASNLIFGLCAYGVAFTLYFLLFSKISDSNLHILISLIFSFVFLSPVGYFLPALFRPMKNIRYITGITALSGMAWETLFIFLNIQFMNRLLPLSQFRLQYFSFILQILAAGVVGCIDGAVGYGALKAANKLCIFCKDLIYFKKSAHEK